MKTLVLREMHEAMHSRWLIAIAAVFALLSLSVSYLSFSGADTLGFAGFNRTVASLLNLVLLFVPLMGLVTGALGLAGEREDGALGYILAQPVSRASVFFAKFLGQGLCLSLAIALGLGLAGLVVGWEAGLDEAGSYGVLAGDALLLGAASLGIGLLVATFAGGRMKALTAALLVWVWIAFVADLALVGLAVGARATPETLFWVSLANPVQVAKTLCMLALSAKLETLGPSGLYAARTFGAGGAAAVLCCALAAWSLVPLAVGWIVFRRQNVR